MAQAPTKHDDPHKDRDPHPEAHAAPKTVGEPGSLVLPLADSGGAPLVGATGVRGEHIEDGERDPDTIAEEQRRRSAAYEAGVSVQDAADPHIDPRQVAHQAPKPEPHAQHENDHRTTKK